MIVQSNVTANKQTLQLNCMIGVKGKMVSPSDLSFRVKHCVIFSEYLENLVFEYMEEKG